jgi:hypothetical protein
MKSQLRNHLWFSRVVFAGGQLPGGNGRADAELYVPANGTFEFVGEMTAGRHSHTATPPPRGHSSDHGRL